MSLEAAGHEATMPTMPERSIRRSEDVPQPPETLEARRYLRSSEPPVGVRTTARRQSEDIPSHQQLTQWQPVHDSQGPPSARPAMHIRSNSHEYPVYEDSEPPATGNYLVPHNGLSRSPSHLNDPYGQRPYRRHGVRESNETYRPLVSERVPRTRPSAQPRWHDTYDDEAPPQRFGPQKPAGGVYLVRTAVGDGSDGNGPPDEIMRLPLMSWMKGAAKGHFVAVLGEFVGTMMFLFFAFAGTLVANIGATESAAQTTTNATVGFSPIVNLYVAVSFGFSLMVNVWIFFRVSGGLFNPAVTLGMVMTKSITYTRGFLLVSAQLVGAIVASFIVQALFPSDFNVRTTLATDTSVARGLIIEAILTAELVFTVFMLAKEKHKATYMAPVGIGLALFVAELVGVFFTGGSLNPARSFGPCVATRQFDSEHWIYWLGPALGAIAAFLFYRFIKILEYEMANPGQDMTAEEAAEARTKEKDQGEGV